MTLAVSTWIALGEARNDRCPVTELIICTIDHLSVKIVSLADAILANLLALDYSCPKNACLDGSSNVVGSQ